MKTYTTKKGTQIPLISLKGKDYMQVAHRLILLTEEHESYTVNTEFLSLSDNQSIAKATISILDKDGKVIRSATATKREDTKGFGDHTEKAETGAIGRALAMLGMGTQHALADMDEGNRLADSPVTDPAEHKASAPAAKVSAPEVKAEAPAAPSSGAATFRKPKKPEPAPSADSWE